MSRRFRNFIASCVCIAVFSAASIAHAADSYATKGDCDGFPRLQLKTAPGLCVGFVTNGLGFARGVAVLDSHVYVTDMGGWVKGKGSLIRLDLKNPGAHEVLLQHLDEPNSIVASGHDTLYIALLGKVAEFDPKAPSTLRDVVVNLPTDGRHPLPAITLGLDGSLYINVGSNTDNCEAENSKQSAANPCSETMGPQPRGVILHIMPKQGAAVDVKDAEVVARGLRNSMALAILPGGQLVAATNARDAIDQADPKLPDEDLPHDTLDWIEKGADYGWPYCFDDNRPAPEYPAFNCSVKHLHTRLLPPHAAPLGMLYYEKGSLPGLSGTIIIPYHGYRALGHRIVKLALDANGKPQGDPQDIVWNWQAIPGTQPMGAPVSVVQQKDGSILVTEDHNGTLLRIAQSPVEK